MSDLKALTDEELIAEARTGYASAVIVYELASRLEATLEQKASVERLQLAQMEVLQAIEDAIDGYDGTNGGRDTFSRLTFGT